MGRGTMPAVEVLPISREEQAQQSAGPKLRGLHGGEPRPKLRGSPLITKQILVLIQMLPQFATQLLDSL